MLWTSTYIIFTAENRENIPVYENTEKSSEVNYFV